MVLPFEAKRIEFSVNFGSLLKGQTIDDDIESQSQQACCKVKDLPRQTGAASRRRFNSIDASASKLYFERIEVYSG